MSRIVLRGGRLIDPAREIDERCDLLIDQGVVEAIEPPGRLGEVEYETADDGKVIEL